jgi:hypothetical protein
MTKRYEAAFVIGCGYFGHTYDAPSAVRAVVKYAAKNPGLEYGNYASSYNDKAGRAAYFAESRQITKDWRRVCDAVRQCEAVKVTNDDVYEAAKHAFSGRLEVTPVRISYCTGQYWPTEYRKAAASVLEYAANLAFRRNSITQAA